MLKSNLSTKLWALCHSLLLRPLFRQTHEGICVPASTTAAGAEIGGILGKKYVFGTFGCGGCRRYCGFFPKTCLKILNSSSNTVFFYQPQLASLSALVRVGCMKPELRFLSIIFSGSYELDSIKKVMEANFWPYYSLSWFSSPSLDRNSTFYEIILPIISDQIKSGQKVRL